MNLLFNHIQKAAAHMACTSPLYNWSLGGTAPHEILVRPVDPWPGNTEAARWLVAEQQNLMQQGFPHDPASPWFDYMHSFTWLRDLRALGGDEARRCARTLMSRWANENQSWEADIWRGDLIGDRLAQSIASFEFFGASADTDFQSLFFDSAARQARHLSRSLPGALYGLSYFKALKGLLYAGLAFEGRESWIEQALDELTAQIDLQILPDGAHISRNPTQLMSALQIMLDSRAALAKAQYPLPETIQHAIDRMGPALRFFRYNDKGFALFNGTQEGDHDLIDFVLGQTVNAKTGIRTRILQSLPCAGYERITKGRSLLMMDCGTPPAHPHDTQAHAAPLSFEFSHGKERLFVSCGTHPDDPAWQDALRATAAHNSLTLSDRNAYEIAENSHFSRKAQQVTTLREDSGAATLIEGTHDGYAALSGVTHRRRLYVSDQGHDLRGEDMLHCAAHRDEPLDTTLRFHIHPRVLVSLVQDGTAALLRLPSGMGWRFQHQGGSLSLKNSIYLGEGRTPRKTKQLVITAQLPPDQATIKWALQKEG